MTQIIFTGLKNGEKMYEELTVDGSSDKTVHPRIFSVEDNFLEWKQLSKILNDLEKNLNSDNLNKIIKIFKD